MTECRPSCPLFRFPVALLGVASTSTSIESSSVAGLSPSRVSSSSCGPSSTSPGWCSLCSGLGNSRRGSQGERHRQERSCGRQEEGGRTEEGGGQSRQGPVGPKGGSAKRSAPAPASGRPGKKTRSTPKKGRPDCPAPPVRGTLVKSLARRPTRYGPRSVGWALPPLSPHEKFPCRASSLRQAL